MLFCISTRTSFQLVASLLHILLAVTLFHSHLSLCSTTSYPSQRPGRNIPRFQPYGRRCFKVSPCILFADHKGSYGCGQCGSDTLSESLVEFVTREELNTFINAGLQQRVVMIPEFLFFEQSVLSALESAKRIVALVVYSGDSPNNKPTPSPTPSILNCTSPPRQNLPYPPVDSLSIDFAEPNIDHNYYPTIRINNEDILPDYSSPDKIIETIRTFEENEKASLTVRNGFGAGLKFRLFRYNIFHVSAETANEIRELSGRFPDTKIIGAQPGSNSERAPTTPSYKLESIGQMYACATQSAPESTGPTATPNGATDPIESNEPGDDDTDLENSSFNQRSTFRFPSISSFIRAGFSIFRPSLRQNGPDVDSSNIAEATSAKCLEESTCLPIGGHSLWSALGRLKPRHDSNGNLLETAKLTENNAEQSNILAIMAPMDSMSFFPDMAFGGSAEISSLAVLLAVSEAVGEYWRTVMKQTDQFLFQPVYFLWNAQSWGWAGSSRFLKDLNNFKCDNFSKEEPGCIGPSFMASLKFYDLNHLDKLHVINIGQLISPNALQNFDLTRDGIPDQFYLNSIARNESGRESCNGGSILEDTFMENYRQYQNNITLTRQGDSRTLYPLDASQSFKRYYNDYNECDKFDVISINNYRQNFTNRYYHSMFDHPNLTSINQPNYRDPLYSVANLIAKIVANISFGDRPELNEIKVESDTINKVITCMTSNWTLCDLKHEYLPNLTIDSDKVSMGNYAGSFFPSTRLDDKAPSWAAKLALMRNMFASFNSYTINSLTEMLITEPEESTEADESDELQPDALSCQNVDNCDELKNASNANVTSQTEWHTVFCTKGKCALSDTYLHDAFGAALESQNEYRSNFIDPNSSKNDEEEDEEKLTEPHAGAWTESVWDEDLGLCGFVEDSPLYGGLILGVGVLLFITTFVLFYYIDTRLFRERTEEEANPEQEEEKTNLTRTPMPP